MNLIYMFPILIHIVTANTIQYKEYTEEDNLVFTQGNIYSHALDRLNQRRLPLDKKYYEGVYTGKNITVYIIDTGINKNIYFNFTCGYNFIKGGDCFDCSTRNVHGTHVGSLISSNLFGTAHDSKIISLRVLNDQGVGLISDVIKAIDYLLDRNVTCSIINMSIGSDKSEILNLKIQELVDNGNRVVVAAGNYGNDACRYSPSSAKGAITVGSSDSRDRRTWFTNRGKCVDVYAPGFTIIGATGGKSTAYLSGTSMSSPLIAGVLAVQMERKGCNARLRISKIRKRFKIGYVGN